MFEETNTARIHLNDSVGTTTFRLRSKGLVILHDTWLEKPEGMKRYLELEDVTELDYVLISHAHFDQ